MNISAPPSWGAKGRVDMYRQGRVGEADRIMLLRVETSPPDPPRWEITVPPKPGMPRISPQRLARALLTKQTLEQAIDFLLGGQ